MVARESLVGQAVLVTGGAGFIGSHLVDRLLKDGVSEVVVIDNFFIGDEENLAEARETGKVTLYRDDAELATSLDYIFSRHPISATFNCATKALNYSFANPRNAFSTNVDVVLNLLEHLRKGSFSSLCHFSSSEAYGSAVYEPMDEDHPLNPTTTYAAGKAAADLAVRSYVEMFGLDAFIVRPFNNYGPRQNFKGPLAGIIPLTARRVLEGGAPEIHGDGQQSRDFIYVEDTVEAVMSLYKELPAGESVNIASNNCTEIVDLVHQICELLGYRGEIVRKEGRPADVLCHNSSTSKLNSLIDPEFTPFEVGLAATLNWYKQRFFSKNDS